jgi:non-ribosomal peptide synthetase component F
LEEISVEQEATLYMTLLSIYVALLASRSGQKEVVVGSPVTFRDREEIEGLVGYFTNVMVLRVKVEGARSYEEVLRGVRGVTLGAYRHQEMAYEILEEEMRGGRGEEPSPLFHVWFNFIKKSQQSYDDSEHTTGLLNVEEIENNTASFDISLVIKQRASGLRISMEYNKDLFDAERVRGMLSEFEGLIERVIADPAATILDIPMFAGPKASAYQGDWDGLREVNAGD